MLATIQSNGKSFNIDLSKPIDISIPLVNSDANPIAWYLNKPKIEPVRSGDFVGSVAEGYSVNFNNIHFNPHAHGTHTECIGHITKEKHSINNSLTQFFFKSQLISVQPELKDNNDLVISKNQIECHVKLGVKALVIRTLPNDSAKKSIKYSDTNPPYLTEEAAIYLREIGVEHLLIDLPSIDKEKDNGQLLAHKAFWNFKGKQRTEATITEFIFVDNAIEDGEYFLNLQIAPFENDASPSKPILYKIEV